MKVRWKNAVLAKRPASLPQFLLFGLAVVFLAFTVAYIAARRGSKTAPLEAASMSKPAIPFTLSELLAIDASNYEQIDIALMNLLCAKGLRGSEGLNVKECLARLDGMASKVEFDTRRHFYRFNQNPKEYQNSEAYYRMLMLTVVLQEDFQIHYNPERAVSPATPEPNEIFYADSRDSFLNGMLSAGRHMGTCSSMPILYIAVGRRLGYPLKLAAAKNHLFVRWEDSRSRFNFDATSRGMSVDGDDYYQKWPYPITVQEMSDFGYLKSMTPAEEFSTFLSLRGHCLIAAGKLNEGIAAHKQSLRVAPHSRVQQLILAMAYEDVASKQKPIAEALNHEALYPNWPFRSSNISEGGPWDRQLPDRIRARMSADATPFRGSIQSAAMR